MENTLSKYGEKAKGLFDQKGGTLGMILLAIGVFFFAIKLPAIIDFVDSLLHLLIVAAASAAILFVLLDKKTRLLAGTLYMMGIRSLMGMVIQMNPIAILEDTISRMYKSINDVEKKMGTLNGVRLKFKDKIKDKKKEIETCLQRKSIAEKQGKRDLEILEDRQVVRLTKLCQTYIDLSDSTEMWYDAMSKIAEKAKLTAQDTENEVAAKKEEYELIKTSHGAFKSAMSILNGDPDQLAMYNQAFQFVSDDIMAKVGEMDRVINSTGGMIDKMDLEKEVFAIKGDDISKKFAELGIDALFTKFDALPSQQMKNVGAEATKVTVKTSVPSTNKSKYFE